MARGTLTVLKLNVNENLTAFKTRWKLAALLKRKLIHLVTVHPGLDLAASHPLRIPNPSSPKKGLSIDWRARPVHLVASHPVGLTQPVCSIAQTIVVLSITDASI
jgi:hypothetical protein